MHACTRIFTSLCLSVCACTSMNVNVWSCRWQEPRKSDQKLGGSTFLVIAATPTRHAHACPNTCPNTCLNTYLNTCHRYDANSVRPYHPRSPPPCEHKRHTCAGCTTLSAGRRLTQFSNALLETERHAAQCILLHVCIQSVAVRCAKRLCVTHRACMLVSGEGRD